MSATVTDNRSARERLLAAADELFYEQGIHTVGIDRIIERAGVAKASLYSAFGSKDELVRAYLESRDESRRVRVQAAVDRHTDPKARLLGGVRLAGQVRCAAQLPWLRVRQRIRRVGFRQRRPPRSLAAPAGGCTTCSSN